MIDKEAIDNLKNYIECLMEDYGYYKDIVEFRDSVEHLEKSLQTQQAEIEKKDKQIEQYQNMLATNDMLHVLECEKKDKIIDLMSEQLTTPIHSKEWVKEYYERKVENEN